MNAFDYLFENKPADHEIFILGSKETLTYGELYLKSSMLSGYLNNHYGSSKEMLLMCPNSAFFIICYLAILKSGNVCIPLSTEIEADNLSYIHNLCSPVLAFGSKGIERKILSLSIPFINDTDLDAILAEPSQDVPQVAFDVNLAAEIIFTSGSTGLPKGVVISHRNIIENTKSILGYLQLTSKDTVLVVLPFYYCYGLSLLHTHIRASGHIVLNNSFYLLGSVIHDLQQFQCTGFAGVPSHFQILLRKSDSFRSTVFPSLRYVTQAGGKLHNTFINEFIETFPLVSFYVMYGQTEATARLSYLPPDRLPEKLGSCGKGIAGVDLRVVDDSGNDIKPGHTGEIIAKGLNIMRGYYKDPEATKLAIRDGWLYTGDLATVDEEGFIYLTARKKEMIKAGGRRISPKEIEEVIVSIPEVIDCTIEGVDDEILGEAIKATVIIKDSSSDNISPEGIRTFCAKKLAPYKVPHFVEIQDKIMLSQTGKKTLKRQNHGS
jgi:acyl-CoA synthetase (AMP-forming)/AMP-acid ligase II